MDFQHPGVLKMHRHCKKFVVPLPDALLPVPGLFCLVGYSNYETSVKLLPCTFCH